MELDCGGQGGLLSPREAGRPSRDALIWLPSTQLSSLRSLIGRDETSLRRVLEGTGEQGEG